MLVEDLGSSGGHRGQRRRASRRPRRSRPGDRVVLGATELTVLWTPSGRARPRRPEPEPAPTAAAPARAGPGAAPPPEPDESPTCGARPRCSCAFACLALGGVRPARACGCPSSATRRAPTASGALDPAGLRVQAVAGGAAGRGRGGGAGCGAAAAGASPRWRLPLAAVTAALAGGLVAGPAAVPAAVDTGGATASWGSRSRRSPASPSWCCAIGGRGARSPASAATRRWPPARCCWWPRAAPSAGCWRPSRAPSTGSRSGATEYGGLRRDLGAGGWLVVLSLGPVAASVLAAGGGARRRPARGAHFAACAAAAAGRLPHLLDGRRLPFAASRWRSA